MKESVSGVKKISEKKMPFKSLNKRFVFCQQYMDKNPIKIAIKQKKLGMFRRSPCIVH